MPIYIYTHSPKKVCLHQEKCMIPVGLYFLAIPNNQKQTVVSHHDSKNSHLRRLDVLKLNTLRDKEKNMLMCLHLDIFFQVFFRLDGTPKWVAFRFENPGPPDLQPFCWKRLNRRLLQSPGRWDPAAAKKKTLGSFTLWLCQNSYWKWPFIVSFPIKNGDFP